MPITVPPAALWSCSSLMRSAVDLAEDEVEVGHALGPVLLAQIGVGVHLGDRRQEQVVGIEVEAELGPHGAVVDGGIAHRCPFAARHARGRVPQVATPRRSKRWVLSERRDERLSEPGGAI